MFVPVPAHKLEKSNNQKNRGGQMMMEENIQKGCRTYLVSSVGLGIASLCLGGFAVCRELEGEYAPHFLSKAH